MCARKNASLWSGLMDVDLSGGVLTPDPHI